MNFNDYQQMSKRTMPQADTGSNERDNLANYAMGVSGEAGEVTDELKKMLFHGHDWNLLKMGEELGDVLHYISGLATMLDLDLNDVAQGNLVKLQRRYNNGFSQDASRNRTE